MHCACKNITKRLRQIRNAWHSQFKLSFVFTVQWIRLSGSVAHYLTRRYMPEGDVIILGVYF